MVSVKRFVEWLISNFGLLLHIGIGLLLAPLIFRTALAFWGLMGAVLVIIGWLLLIYRIVNQKIIDHKEHRGIIDSREAMLSILRVYGVETGALIILMILAIMELLLWPSVFFGVWLLANAIAIFWLWRRYKEELTGKRIVELVSSLTVVEVIVSVLIGLALGFAIMGWFIGVIARVDAMLIGAVVALVWLLAKLLTAHLYGHVGQ